MKREVLGLAVAGALTAGIGVTGCGDLAPASTAINFEKPNNTIEQVANNLGYQKELGNFSLHQTISFDLPSELGKQRVNIYNYTGSRVDPATTENLANFYEDAAGAGLSFKAIIDVDSQHPKQLTAGTAFNNLDTEHDLLLLPNTAPDAPVFDGGDEGLGGITREYASDGDSQTISVVRQPIDSNAGQLTGFLKGDDAAFTTEMCQALVAAAPDSATDGLVTNRLMQETYCNSLGDAATDAEQNVNYSTYVTRSQDTSGIIPIGFNNYTVRELTFGPSLYAGLEQVFNP